MKLIEPWRGLFKKEVRVLGRALELTQDRVHQYGGGCSEYVARTGQEAPGLRPGG